MRRFIIVLVITLLPLYRNTQIVGQLWTTLFVMSYVAYVRPYEVPYLNVVEVINEVTILQASYPLFVFTEWVYDMQRRVEAGWFVIGCILFSILFNVTFLVIISIKSTKQRCKLWYAKRAARKQLEERRRNHKVKAVHVRETKEDD